LVPGSRVESAQSGTGISMTVYIEKDEGGQRIVRHGPVVLASGAILGLNEFGQMRNIEDHKYFTDAAEEGTFTVTKHGFNLRIIAHPSIIITANPIGGFWKNSDIIDPSEFPILIQMGERLDFIIPFIEKTDEESIRYYAGKRRELAKRLGDPSIEQNTLWLKRYLLYARSLSPQLSDEVRKLLEDFLVEMAKQGVRGLPRKLDALERTAIGFAKLKLKSVVDEEDVYDTIELFNSILKYFKQEVTNKNPRDLLLQECEKILEANEGYEWCLDPLVDKICFENTILDKYIGPVKKSQYNSKIKALKPFLEKNPNIHRTNNNPTAYTWLGKNNNKDNREKRNLASGRNSLDHTSSVNTSKSITDKSPDVPDATDRCNDKSENYLKPSPGIQFSKRENKTESDNFKIKIPASDTSVSSGDNPIIIEHNNTVEQKLQLTHSKSAHVMTNEDLDVEEGET
jgi:hypothetical protein